MIRVSFVMEQHLGHRTYAQNLRRYTAVDPRLEPSWVDVTYFESGHLWERLPLPKGLKGTGRGVRQVRRGLKAPCDAAFFNTQVPAVFAFDWLRRIPCIISTDITPIQYDTLAQAYGHRPDRGGPVKTFKYRLNREVFRRAKKIIAWSQWVSHSLQTDYGMPPDKICVIPPGVDLDFWRPAPRVQENALVKILFVGGDFERKGGKRLLEAFRQIGASRAELHLVTRDIVPYEPGVHVYHGLTPNHPELLRLYQQSDLFVLPAEAEAFGIAAVEASACGLPAIVSRAGGLGDVVVEEETGLLLPPGDTQALKQALDRLIRAPDLRREMGAATRQRAETRFDARTNARRITDLLVEAVNR